MLTRLSPTFGVNLETSKLGEIPIFAEKIGGRKKSC